ncbi:MAG: M1 family metallopeptidase [Bacteroidota bacterium]
MNRMLALVALILLSACGTPRVATIEEPIEIEQRQLDTLVVTAPPIETAPIPKNYTLPNYNPSHTQIIDLLHTKLELSFDWPEEQVIGIATLNLRPYFYPISSFKLDAKGFAFNSIKTTEGIDLEYEYDDKQVNIILPRTYTRDEEITIIIDYLATPRPDGGSDAITSDKGLFFVNPRGEEGDKPQQIWTQGETEHNSRWFPTVDKPNERCTQEMYLTVEDRFKTLSNGLLIESTENNDGTRTDYWKMDQPHAPYLFMIAIGEFAVVEDEPYNGKPVNYYVEPEYEEHAEAIYPHTPEMLKFFSGVTGVDYPWQKYSQVVVRDYVSGAMENTTGVIFGDFIQQTERELIDVLINDKIVAHELFHHWFGDYVTCESWANLTMNEGFANYSEYLWLEHHYGRDEADQHLMEEWQGYLGSVMNGGIHPLIHYGHNDKEEMFDAHSYNKGGAVLHMLRKSIGDEAFFAGFEKYLTDNAYSAVEVAELRMAFEEVTGQDMHWFFDQWFLEEGHPSISLSYDYDASTQEAIIQVDQTQETGSTPPIFQLPAKVDLYFAGTVEPVRHEVFVNQRSQQIRLSAASKPALTIFDAERSILATWDDNKTHDELAYQLKNAPLFLDRYQAVNGLDTEADDYISLLELALQDPFYGIRSAALTQLPSEDWPASITEQVAKLAAADEHSEVRSIAIVQLAEVSYEGIDDLAQQALDAQPYAVVGAGLDALAYNNPALALEAADKLADEENADIVEVIGGLYADTGDAKYLPYFTKNLTKMEGFSAISFYESFGSLLVDTKGESLEKGIKQLRSIGTNQGESPWCRIASIKTLSEVASELSEETDAAQITTIQEAIDAIKEAETNPQLRGIYQQF